MNSCKCGSNNIAEYNLNKGNYICNPCNQIKNRNHYINNKEKRKFQANERYQRLKKENCLKTYAQRMLAEYRYRDNQKFLNSTCDFNYKEYLLFIEQPCFYCEETTERRGLDRIDNNLGHIKINCLPCCITCNRTRNNYFTVDEMKQIGKLIKEIKKIRMGY